MATTPSILAASTPSSCSASASAACSQEGGGAGRHVKQGGLLGSQQSCVPIGRHAICPAAKAAAMAAAAPAGKHSCRQYVQAGRRKCQEAGHGTRDDCAAPGGLACLLLRGQRLVVLVRVDAGGAWHAPASGTLHLGRWCSALHGAAPRALRARGRRGAARLGSRLACRRLGLPRHLQRCGKGACGRSPVCRQKHHVLGGSTLRCTLGFACHSAGERRISAVRLPAPALPLACCWPAWHWPGRHQKGTSRACNMASLSQRQPTMQHPHPPGTG